MKKISKGEKMKSKLHLRMCGFIAFMSFVTKLPCLSGDFVFDDRPAILKNQDVFNVTKSWLKIFSNDFWGGNLSAKSSHKSYRPLTTLTFRLNAVLNESPPYFHLVNSYLHASNCVLVFITLKKILKHTKTAFISSMIFSVHPVHTEAVCGLVGRADLLWTFFALLSIVVAKNISYVMILSALSLMAKEQGIMVIPIIILVNFIRKPDLRKSLKDIAVYFPFLMIMLYLRLKMMNFSPPIFQEGDNPAGFLDSRLWKTINIQYIYALNLWIMLLPEWLCYDWAMRCIGLVTSMNDIRLFVLPVLWILFLTLLYRRRFYEIVFLAVPFLPSANILVTVGFVIAERNLYLSVLGYSLLLANGIFTMKRTSKKFSKCAKYFIIITFTLRSFLRAFDWQNEENLFKSGLKVCPKNAKVHYNLAKIATNPSDAIKYYESAIFLWPKYEHAMNNLGNIYKNQGRNHKAEDLFKRALVISPKFATCHMNLGIVQSNLNKFAESEESYKRALKFRPYYPDCLFNLATLYLKTKDFQKAVETFEKAIEQNSEHFSAHTNLVILLDDLGKYEEAEFKAKQALKVFPDKADFYFHLANIYGKVNKFQHAENLYQKAIELSHAKVPIYFVNFGVLYHRWKKFKEARKYYQMALKLDPYLKSALSNLASLPQT